MTIQDILSLFPHQAGRLSQEISNAGLNCIGCSAATWETLELGMMTHGKTDEQIDDLVTRLNALLDEQDSNPYSITLTKIAAEKYQEILKAENKSGYGIRFTEQPAGCNGFEYLLDYSEKPLPADEVYTSQGIDIHVDAKMAPRLLGSVIDYVDGLQNSGFKVINPNVRSSCGCGSSHGY